MSGQEGKGMLCQQWVYFNLRIFIIFFKDEITSMFKYRQGRSYREEEAEAQQGEGTVHSPCRGLPEKGKAGRREQLRTDEFE